MSIAQTSSTRSHPKPGSISPPHCAREVFATLAPARDSEVTPLRVRVRGLVAGIGQLLPGDDPRRHALGLSPPDAREIPDGLVLTPGVPSHGSADWADAPRSTRHRVFKQVVGTDPDFIPVVTVTDSDASVWDLPSRVTANVRMTAVNEESVVVGVKDYRPDPLANPENPLSAEMTIERRRDGP